MRNYKLMKLEQFFYFAFFHHMKNMVAMKIYASDFSYWINAFGKDFIRLSNYVQEKCGLTSSDCWNRRLIDGITKLCLLNLNKYYAAEVFSIQTSEQLTGTNNERQFMLDGKKLIQYWLLK